MILLERKVHYWIRTLLYCSTSFLQAAITDAAVKYDLSTLVYKSTT